MFCLDVGREVVNFAGCQTMVQFKNVREMDDFWEVFGRQERFERAAFISSCRSGVIDVFERTFRREWAEHQNGKILELCVHGGSAIFALMLKKATFSAIRKTNTLGVAIKIRKGDADVVRVLIEAGANANHDNGVFIIMASDHNHLEALKVLVEAASIRVLYEACTGIKRVILTKSESNAISQIKIILSRNKEVIDHDMAIHPAVEFYMTAVAMDKHALSDAIWAIDVADLVRLEMAMYGARVCSGRSIKHHLIRFDNLTCEMNTHEDEVEDFRKTIFEDCRETIYMDPFTRQIPEERQQRVRAIMDQWSEQAWFPHMANHCMEMVLKHQMVMDDREILSMMLQYPSFRQVLQQNTVLLQKMITRCFCSRPIPDDHRSGYCLKDREFKAILLDLLEK